MEKLQLKKPPPANSSNDSQPFFKPAVIQRKVSPQMPTIRDRLDDSWFSSIDETEAHEVITILKNLKATSEQDFNDTVALMEKEKLVMKLLSNVSKNDKLNEKDTLQAIADARVFIRKDGSNETVTKGSCSPERFQQIQSSTMQAAGDLDRALALTDAYIAKPEDSTTAATKAVFVKYFKSFSPDVMRYVRTQLHNIRRDLTERKNFSIECHDSWDTVCDAAGAYIPAGDPNRMIFCTNFFEGGKAWQAETMVHEMSHTQVGVAHVTDRAYTSDRALPIITTAEALTNAESYGLYVDQLASGHAPEKSAPHDSAEDCAGDWWPLIQTAIARAQRDNRNAQVVFSTLTPDRLKTWNQTNLLLLGGNTQKDIDRAKEVYDKAEDALRSSISFECESDDSGRCKTYLTYWYAAGDLHICPKWKAQASEDERIITLLAGYYGYEGLEKDNTRRNNYARLSHNLTKERWPAPTLAEVLANPPVAK